MGEPITLISAVTAAVSAVVTILSESSRARARNYQEKRLVVIMSILADHRDVLDSGALEALKEEVRYVVEDVLASSSRFRQDRILNWNEQVWWRKFLTLPRPHSVSAFLGVLVFYMYLLVACSMSRSCGPRLYLIPKMSHLGSR